MKLAVISDIHGNLGAFKAVLADMDAHGATCAVSLGDNVGYGPDPGPVLRLVASRHIPSVAGNHEMAVADARWLREFNSQSRDAVRMTMDWLDDDEVELARAMPRVLVRDGCRFVHGMPPDSPFTYLYEFHGKRLATVFDRFPEPICFVGHTHDLELVRRDADGVVAREPLTEGPRVLPAGGRYLVNAGSVGQPRDGDNRAKYLLWEPAPRRLTVRFVPYDVQDAARRFREAGVNERYVLRLL